MVDILSNRPKKYTEVKTNNYIYIHTIDVDSDMNEDVSFEKDGKIINLKRKDLYELIFMIEDEDETLDSISSDRFRELLTVVKL